MAEHMGQIRPEKCEGEEMTASWLGPVKQISYTTDDVDRLADFWENQVGIGPWSVFRNLTLAMEFEGRQIALPVNVGLTVHGGVLIELMQVLGDGPSPFHDNLNRPIIGLQRLAAATDDIEADTRAAVERGMELFASGRDATGQRYTYFRSAAAPGVILELLENIPSFGTFVSGLEARAAAYRNAVAGAGEATPLGAPGAMKAAEIYDYGGPDEFHLETIPEPMPGPGEVRVKVEGAAVNPVDVKARRGILKDWMPLTFPARLGGDVAGTIDAVGAGVVDFAVGDRVMGMINPMANGAYAEKVVFYTSSFAKVPEGMEMTAAAALPTGVLTGVQLIEKGIAPKPGAKGLVTGAGGSTGRAAALAALDAGAIVYAGVRASSRDAVVDLPVAGVIDLTDDAALKAAGPFDFMADTVGGETAERLFAYLKPNGVVCSIAVPPPNPPPGSNQRFSSLVVSFDRARLERFTRDLRDKGRTMPVAHILPLSKVSVAHGLMEQGGVGGKIVLVP
jgi:NADPH:quinone reductase-like Zn-dependent oxidoreductase